MRNSRVRSYKKRVKGKPVRVRAHQRKVLRRNELARRVAKGTGLSNAQANKTLGVVVFEMNKELGQGHQVAISDLGTFNVKTKPARKARMGMNPFTKQKVMLKAKPKSRVVKFRPSKSLKQKVN